MVSSEWFSLKPSFLSLSNGRFSSSFFFISCDLQDSIASRQTKKITIELDDVEEVWFSSFISFYFSRFYANGHFSSSSIQFDDDGPSFAFKIQRNVKRYLTLFSSAVDRVLPLPDNEV